MPLAVEPPGPSPRSLAAAWLSRAALLWLVGLFALRSGQWAAGGVAAALVLASAALGRGLWLHRTGQLVVAVLGVGMTWPLHLVLRAAGGDAAGSLGTLGTVLALGGLLLALPRQLMAAPRLGETGNASLNLLVLLGCSHATSGRSYPVFIFIFVLLQLLALRAADPDRPALRSLSRRHRAALAAMAAVFGVTAVGLSLSIPPAQKWAMRRFYFFISGMWKPETGLTDGLELGTLSGITASDRVVARVFGPQPDHLRGHVFARYAGGGRWLAGRPSRLVAVRLPPPGEEGGEATRVVPAGGSARTYLLPLDAARVRAGLERALVDGAGLLQTPAGESAGEAWFRLGPRDSFRPAPPGVEDLAVPEGVASQLRALARTWTRGETRAGQQLGALQRRLQRHYKYALEVARPRGIDPLLHFLTVERSGHCEYFASALALLARAAGIPARVVTGYRVRERNPLGGYHLVRERNAHAWVEAWTGGAWRTFDPTPASAQQAGAGLMSFPAALGDLVSSYLARGWRWVTGLTLAHLGGAAGLLVSLWVLVLLLRRRRRGAAAPGLPLEYGPENPGLTSLLDALASRGVGRHQAEPLEAYARRLASDPGLSDRGPDMSALLLRYAAWRYGARGEPRELERELEALARQVSSAGR